MTPSRPLPSGTDPVEEPDPTGVRALLQSLPAPGPMPAELVARIEARIASEPALQNRATSDRHEEAEVVDLGAERVRRRPGRSLAILGAAAGGLLVTTVALSQVMNGGGAGDAMSAAWTPGSQARTSAQADSAGGAAADEESSGAGAFAVQDGAAADGAGTADGGDDAAAETAAAAAGHDADTGDQALEPAPKLPVAAELELLPPLGEVEGDFGELLAGSGTFTTAPSEITVAQALSCWKTVSEDDAWQLGSWSRYTAAPATREGRDVIALLATAADGRGAAWLVPGTCTTDPTVRPVDFQTVAP